MSRTANTTIRITDQATTALRNINVALRANIAGFDNLQRALDSNTAALNRQRGANNNASQAQRKTNQAAREGITVFSGLNGKLAALAGAYLSVHSAQKFLTETDTYISNTARLDIMNDGLRTTDKLYKEIYHSAQRSIAPVNDVMANVTKLGIAAKDAFKNNDEIIAFVETFNKAATVGGASNTEKSNALYQLTQAFGSGRLQGDELRSVRENAPLLWNSIQKELVKQYGEGADIRKLAADGLISPQVIKNAAFASAEEIDKQFQNMPFAFGDIMTQAFNKIKFAMTPMFVQMRKIINDPAVKAAVNQTVNYIIQGIHVVWNLLQKAGQAVMWFGSKWKDIAPWIYGVAAAIGAVVAVIGIYRATVAIAAGITAIITAATWLWNTAQAIINGQLIMTAILTGGLPLIITAVIVAVLALAAIVIWQLDYVMGAIYTASAFLWNLGIGIYNGFLSLLDSFIDPVIDIIEWFYNAFTGGFDSIGDACLNIIGNIVAGALGVIKPLLEIWDYITDTNAAGAVEAAQNAARDWGKNKNAKTLDRGFLQKSLGVSKEQRLNYGEMFDAGKQKGADWQKNMKSGVTSLVSGAKGYLGDMFKVPGGAELDQFAGIVGTKDENPLLKDIAKNTGDTAKNTAKQDDDYKLLRDVMAQRAVSRVGASGGTVKVEMTNNNNIASKIDIKGFLEALANTMQEAASTAAQGLHS